MPVITLPDGSQRLFDAPVSVGEVAANIGAGLAKATLAGVVDGNVVDASYVITGDASLSIVTDRSDEALDIIRHSSAHLLAMAVKQLFPSAQVTIGPVIDDGFYYDFAFERAFTPEDLEAIETRMAELVAQDHGITREEWQRDDAVAFFKSIGEHYKAEIIASIPDDQAIGLYRQGDFIDLCRGPHVPSTSKLPAFKLTKVAGAYWRGDSNNEMLQRIYGTAWSNKKELNAYITRLAEAEKRDHRKVNKKLDLFHMQEEAPGSVFWHPKGWTLFRELLEYMRARQDAAEYVEVNTPDVMDRSLWETSGHWFNYRENMFSTQTEDERIFALKPMNCPGSVSMFAQGLKSYRDLPLRMAEFGKVHRYEPSGALHGLMRVRHFTQDDAHIFCTPEQLADEIVDVLKLVHTILSTFGYSYTAYLATRPEKYLGTDEIWGHAISALVDAAERQELKLEDDPGGGVFYGPKIDFKIKDALGREWQGPTVQVDFNLPDRFDIQYLALLHQDRDGRKCQRICL